MAIEANTQRDSLGKHLLRSGWRWLLLCHAIVSARHERKVQPRVFYGGARAGHLGGPLVKVRRLQEYFPQHPWGFNLVYALSNAPYLPRAALQWLRWKGVPLVLNQNGIFYSGWYSGDWEQQNKIMAQAYHRADHVFWQSDFCRRSADRFLGVRNGPGEILFNAIDVSRFAPVSENSSRPFTFLVTGKIGRHLGYRLASTIAGLAAARSSGLDARLTIAGWVEDPGAIRGLIDQYGLANHVTISGPYSQDAAPAIYQSADAYVMTKYLDPCPNTVIEAMACGLPVLYSASGGVPELVGELAGVGLPVPEDWGMVHVPAAEAIADGMLEVATKHGAMSRAARERAVERFDIRNWIARHREVFASLLENKR